MVRKEINYMHKKGEGYKNISKALHSRQNTEAKVIQRFKKDGRATVLQRHPGCPKKITSGQKHLLMRKVGEKYINDRCAGSLQLAKAIERQTGGTVSINALRPCMKKQRSQFVELMVLRLWCRKVKHGVLLVWGGCISLKGP
uniref:Transposase Tc1-like domain-containing protein n=1 Tax=Oryzias latipes TaxID=8090 RepID=A0A3P9IPQ2_ORYLA